MLMRSRCWVNCAAKAQARYACSSAPAIRANIIKSIADQMATSSAVTRLKSNANPLPLPVSVVSMPQSVKNTMPNSVHTVPQMTLAAMCCQMGTGRASIKYPRSPNRR